MGVSVILSPCAFENHTVHGLNLVWFIKQLRTSAMSTSKMEQYERRDQAIHVVLVLG
jgi:hypothetical protein